MHQKVQKRIRDDGRDGAELLRTHARLERYLTDKASEQEMNVASRIMSLSETWFTPPLEEEKK